MITLRPYQLEGVEQIRSHLREGARRNVLCLPTGAGKTIVAAHIAQSALTLGSRTLFVAHRRELIRQPFCRFVASGIDPQQIGIIMAGVSVGPCSMFAPTDDASTWTALARRRPHAPIQIASIQTLSRRALPEADLIIIDEAHRTLSKSYLDLLAHYPNAVVLGLTATPTRTDRRGLNEAFQRLVVVAQYRDLVEIGALVAPKIWTVDNLPDVSRVKTKGDDYDPTQLDEAMNRQELVGDIVDHWKRRGNNAPTFAFAVSVSHSRRIAEQFAAAGIKAAHVDGSTPVAERDAIFAKLARGDLRVVSNCDLACEGTDVPCVKTIALARPTQSLRIHLQQCGRGSRPHESGLPFVILDHAGNCIVHGEPQMDRAWTLEPQAKKKDTAPMSKRCPGCNSVVPVTTSICPECSFAFGVGGGGAAEREITERAGELVELTDNHRFAAVVAEWHKHNARNPVPLKPGWVFKRYEEKYGGRPPRGVTLPELTSEQKLARAEWQALGGNKGAFAKMRRAWA